NRPRGLLVGGGLSSGGGGDGDFPAVGGPGGDVQVRARSSTAGWLRASRRPQPRNDVAPRNADIWWELSERAHDAYGLRLWFGRLCRVPPGAAALGVARCSGCGDRGWIDGSRPRLPRCPLAVRCRRRPATGWGRARRRCRVAGPACPRSWWLRPERKLKSARLPPNPEIIDVTFSSGFNEVTS